MSDLHLSGALDAARAIAAGRVTSAALMESCLERIAVRENEVGAWTHLDREHVLAEARARDGETPRSLLHGVPVGVKDVLDTADMPTAYGSPIYAGHRPRADAACVALLRAAGLVVLGKTVTTEFAYRYTGKTRNPINLEHTPGGSSSGSAAAVADFMVPLGIGTQTAGSVIRPASYCGVVGYKPTFGTINRAGLKFLAESLDTIGVFARHVPDAGIFAAILAGWSPGEIVKKAASAPRVGLCRTPAWDQAEPSTRDALEEAAGRLGRAGAKVSDVELPVFSPDISEAQKTIQTHEAWLAFSYEREVHGDSLSDAIKAELKIGGECPPERYAMALETATTSRAALGELFSGHDVLLAPSAPGEAPRGLTTTGDPVFNRPWTLLGTPCITLPGFFGPQDLPVGVQVIGPRAADAATLGYAMWIQDALD